MTECKVTTMDTWLGPLTIVQTAKGVRFVDLDDGARQFAREAEGQFVRIPGLPESTAEFEAYFSGTLREFTSPVDLVGTPFQLRCWEALRLIPYGQTITYAQEGQRIGTRGFRAVGQPAQSRGDSDSLSPCDRSERPGRLFWRQAMDEARPAGVRGRLLAGGMGPRSTGKHTK